MITVQMEKKDWVWLCELLSDTAFIAQLEQHSDAERLTKVLKQLVK